MSENFIMIKCNSFQEILLLASCPSNFKNFCFSLEQTLLSYTSSINSINACIWCCARDMNFMFFKIKQFLGVFRKTQIKQEWIKKACIIFTDNKKKQKKNTKMMWKKRKCTLHDLKEHILSSVVRLKQGMLVPEGTNF